MKRFLNLTLGLLLAASFSLNAQTVLDSDQPVAVKHALSGWSTAIDGSWAIISSPQKDNGTSLSVGEVSFMEYLDGRWALRQIVQPSGLPVLSNFGFSVDLQDEIAVIGSMGDAETGRYTGSLHVYHLEGENWNHQTTLRSTHVKNEDRFGSSVDLHNNLIVTGAPMADGAEDKSGAVIVFENVDGAWMETAQFSAEDGANGDFFGHSVEIINENKIAVGAYNAVGAEAKSGAVFIFERDDEQWIQTAKLSAPSGKSQDVFGYSLTVYSGSSSFEDEVLVFIGAPGTDNAYGQTGSVYAFEKSGETWTLVSEIMHEDPTENAHFGYSLSVNSLGDLFVGASRVHSEDRKENGQVFVYSFFREGDVLSFENNTDLRINSEQNFSHFGAYVSSSDEFIMVSSPYDDRNGLSNSGSVFFYGTTAVSLDEEVQDIQQFDLFQNYPNPFNPSTVISYQVPVNSEVSLRVFDMLGREVATLVDGETKASGTYNVIFDAGNLASGMYVYQMRADNTIITKKLTLIK